MSNITKNEIKNLHLKVVGSVSDGIILQCKTLEVIVTNDSIGKTISIHDGERMFTIPFEPIEIFLK